MTGLITQTSCWASALTAASNCSHEDKPSLGLGQLVYSPLALNHCNKNDQAVKTDFHIFLFILPTHWWCHSAIVLRVFIGELYHCAPNTTGSFYSQIAICITLLF